MANMLERQYRFVLCVEFFTFDKIQSFKNDNKWKKCWTSVNIYQIKIE